MDTGLYIYVSSLWMEGIILWTAVCYHSYGQCSAVYRWSKTVVLFWWVSVRIFWYQYNAGVDAGLYISSLWRVSKVWLILWTGMGSAVRYARASGNPWRDLQHPQLCFSSSPVPIQLCPQVFAWEGGVFDISWVSISCVFVISSARFFLFSCFSRSVHSCFSERNKIIKLESYR